MVKHYRLTHYYTIDKNKNDIIFSSKYSEVELSEIIAYIQFEADEIEQGVDLLNEHMIKLIKKYYDSDLTVSDYADGHIELDQYYIWEYYCGDARWVMTKLGLNRDGLINDITEMLESYKNTQK